MKLAYCDFIADLIRRAITNNEKTKAGPVQWDLHPDGYMLSTTKTILVSDWQGKKYKVEIKEI